MIKPVRSTVDAAEVHQFSRIAESWWDETGAFRPLHRMNPVRIGYIRDAAAAHFSRNAQENQPFDGLTLADIGCGGGLLAEPLARLGFAVTGVDASEQNIAVASQHAQQAGLEMRYLATSAEELAEKADGFDIVTALEIIEHVADAELFVASLAKLVKPGGLLFISTLNRTLKSLAVAKIGAEYILRALPRGTHDWRKFLMPHEIEEIAARHGLTLKDASGMTYRPLRDSFALSRHDLSVNYLMVFAKPQ